MQMRGGKYGRQRNKPGGDRQDRVVLANGCGHQVEDDRSRGAGGDERQWCKDAAMTPMKEMPFAQAMQIAGTHRGTRVEQTIANVNGPGAQREQHRNPERQANACGPGKSKRPRDRDSRSVQAGQMPQEQRPGRAKPPDRSVCGAQVAVLIRRVCEGKRHCLDFRFRELYALLQSADTDGFSRRRCSDPQERLQFRVHVG